MGYDGTFSIRALQAAYRNGESVVGVLEAAYARIEATRDNPVWISLAPFAQTRARAQALTGPHPQLPLYGVPFAVKDNIDVAGMETTAACPPSAYRAEQSAFVVRRLEQSGAICIGKTNLDQFATGLVGTRSPYGACRNAFDARYVSGGSSSGSALAVALGHVGFAIGTDTAGSGRIPAAFNNIVGLKPTPGLVSTQGVIPACRSLDCVSIFALDCVDALQVLEVAAAFDSADPYSCRERPVRSLDGLRFAVPRPAQLEFGADDEYRRLYDGAVARLRSLGATPVEIDFAPFVEVRKLLYEGPWIAERAAAVGPYVARYADAIDPAVRQSLGAAQGVSAQALFEAMHRLAQLRRDTEAVWASASYLLLPAAPTIYRLEQIAASPLALNATLGCYTNFVNLLGLAAVNVPGGFRSDGLPFGLSLVGPAHSDTALARCAARLHAALGEGAGAVRKAMPSQPPAPCSSEPRIQLAVVGAHLSGLPLNPELTTRGGRLVARTCTAACYRLYLLDSASVQRPGMVRVEAAEEGTALEVEVWEMPLEQFGTFVATVPPPLAIGTVALGDGSLVKGFVCERYAVLAARDISAYGGWRAWLAHANERAKD